MGCLKRTSSPSSDRPEQGWSCDQPTRHHRSNCEQPQVPNGSDFMSVSETTKAKFHPGQIVATPGALEALQAAGQQPHEFLVERVMNCSPVFPGVFGMKAARNRPAEVPKRRNPCVFRHYSS